MEAYSVLMSVYYKEKAEFLEASMESIWAQSCPTDNFVLVCDGALTPELDRVIEQQQKKHRKNLIVTRLEQGVGLGRALNHGMEYCTHEIIARMDSDDISKPKRMERQLKAMQEHNADMTGSAVEEFTDSIQQLTVVRKMPETAEEIRRFAGKRNPFNHPSMMYKKNAVLAVGGYQDCPMFEDYYLWARMLKAGYQGYNIQESLLYMRAGADMYQRRGGLRYAKLSFQFRTKLKKMGISTWQEYFVSAFGQIIISLIPNSMREIFYRKFLRK